MLDPNYIMPVPETKEYEILADDVYSATVSDVEKIISMFKDDNGNDREVFKFTFDVGNNRKVFKEVYPSAFIGKQGPSVLLQIINAVRKCDATEQEAKSITAQDINDLVGKPLRVTVSHKTSKAGNVYNKVDTFLASKDTELPPAVGNVEDIPF